MSRDPVPGILSPCSRRGAARHITSSRGRSIDPRLAALAEAFSRRQAGPGRAKLGPEAALPHGALVRASVALVVRAQPADLELLVIKRATRSGDPWSGHMALPGGRASDSDGSSRATAERETWEEVGIDLAGRGQLLGRLDDVLPRPGAPAIAVSPFAFAAPRDAALVLNHEVEAAFWIPLRDLAAPGAATEYLHALASGEQLRFPAIAYESHVIWGLTHRIMTEFLDIVGQARGDRAP